MFSFSYVPRALFFFDLISCFPNHAAQLAHFFDDSLLLPLLEAQRMKSCMGRVPRPRLRSGTSFAHSPVPQSHPNTTYPGSPWFPVHHPEIRAFRPRGGIKRSAILPAHWPHPHCMSGSLCGATGGIGAWCHLHPPPPIPVPHLTSVIRTCQLEKETKRWSVHLIVIS